MKKTIVALIYDFDKTLCDRDMQEYAFIPNLGLTPEEFWQETDILARENKMDKILACMYMMKEKSQQLGIPLKRENLTKLGEYIKFYPGIKEWFSRINEYGNSLGLEIEHYIISSGMKEIIEGTEISKYFKEIYACEFLYDQNGIVTWPAMSVNYTTKTQFLSRINKGVLDISEDKILNAKMLDEDRRISTKNMIYIGDGFTDIPSMRMVREKGGYAIAVYQQNKLDTVKDLLKEDRIDYAVLADYSENSTIDILVKELFNEMKINTHLREKHKNQLNKFNSINS